MNPNPFEPDKKPEEQPENRAGQSAGRTEQPENRPDLPLPGETYADFQHRLARQQEERQQEEDAPREYWAGLSDHGRGRTGDPNYGPIPEEYAANGMSKAAFVCGILSLVSILFNGSVLFGSLGILFALLSRKNKLSRQARAGLIMSAAGLLTFVIMLVLSISLLVSSGVWDKMMNRLLHPDAQGEISAADLQQELMEDLLEYYGVQQTGVTRT